jgi:tRNA(Arg) A34 adenosine deaminase TadA
MNDADFMRRAVELSRECMRALEGGPFGAVIAKDGRIVAEGSNMVTSANDPTAHAEVVAIRNACRALANHNLSGCEIYASCEPCPMCLSAIYWARLDGIVYANTRADAARIGFDDDLIYQEVARPLEARRLPVRRLLGEEALAVFHEWESLPDKKPY